MEINIVTIVLGMIVSFTLPLLFVSCVLVFILWSRQDKTLSSDVESVSTNLNSVIKHSEDPKLLRVINSLYSIIHRMSMQESDKVHSFSSFGNQNRMKNVVSVASKLIRFGRIRDIEGLGRLTSHLTGVVIVLNPKLDHGSSKQETGKTILFT